MKSWTCDPKKARLNVKNHKVRFEDAAGVFLDPLARIEDDAEHGRGRYKIVGCPPGKSTVLVVVYAEVSEDEVRIISAWRASKSERSEYEDQ